MDAFRKCQIYGTKNFLQIGLKEKSVFEIRHINITLLLIDLKSTYHNPAHRAIDISGHRNLEIS